MARFHTYSFGNVLLISTQRPTATQVAGWRGWNELGRRIKQGEKGILIFAPILAEPRQQEQQAQPNERTARPQSRNRNCWASVRCAYGTCHRPKANQHPPMTFFADLELSEVLSKLTEFAWALRVSRSSIQTRSRRRGEPRIYGQIRLMPDMEAGETVSVLIRELALQMLYRDQAPQLCNPRCLAQRSKGRCFCGLRMLWTWRQSQPKISSSTGAI